MATQSLSVPETMNRRQLWMAALKLPIYTVAIAPIWLGTAVAYFETGRLVWPTLALFLVAAILIVTWSHLTNDLFDAETGVDVHKAHSYVALIGNKSLVFWLGNLFLGLGLAAIVAIAWWQQDPTVAGLIALCCILGYSYQGPPFRFGYQGWGEILCFICYGPLALSAVYYSQTQSWSWLNLAVSSFLGLTTTAILFCSHFHQFEDDRAAGKRSPIVRLGTARAAQLLPWLGTSAYGLVGLGAGVGFFPVWALLSWLSFPFAFKLFRFVGNYHDQPAQVSRCKFIAVSMHFWSAFLLGLGFYVST